MKEKQINDYLKYSEAVRESVIPGYKSNWPDADPVEDSVQPVTEDTTQDSEQENQTSEPEE